MNSDVRTIDPEAIEYLPAKTLLRLMEKSQQTAKNAEAFRQTLAALPDLFRMFEMMDIEPRFDLENDYITLQFSGDGNKLAEVWVLLRQHGYKVTRPKKGDTEFCAFWERERYPRFFMYFSSSVCRRVQIGTEMKEVPIYEIRCGELPVVVEEDTKAVAVEQANDIPF